MAVIEDYFWSGFSQKSIVRFLHEYHGIDLSERTLRRRLSDYGLSGVHNVPTFNEVWAAINSELRGPGIIINTTTTTTTTS